MAGLENPYAAPESALADGEPPPGSPIKAVLAGLGVDFGGTFFATLVLGILYGIGLGVSGAGADDIAFAGKHVGSIAWLNAAGICAGGAFSMLGGYVCARIARRNEARLGAILGAISTLLGLLAFPGNDHFSFGENISLNAFTFILVMIGARIGYGRNRRASVRASLQDK